jgi:drug/metabolite transporter (DMT)-like permease
VDDLALLLADALLYSSTTVKHLFMESVPNGNGNLGLIPAAIALGTCIMFGSNSIAVKISITGLGVYFTACARFIIASACLGIWALATSQPLIIERKKWIPLGIISVTFSLQLLLFYSGLSKTTASRSSLIANLQPFIVLFLAHFFIPGDRINLKKVVGIMLAFGGLAFVFFDNTVADSNLRDGDLIVLGGAIIWGCNAVYTKRVINDFEPIQLSLYPMIISIPISFLASLLFDQEMIRFVDPGIIAALLYQSLIAAAFGYVIWNILLKRYGAVSLHSFVFIIPITGVVLGGIMLDEPITVRLLVGMVLIVIGLLTIHIKQKTVRPLSTISRNV